MRAAVAAAEEAKVSVRGAPTHITSLGREGCPPSEVLGR
jgi:hypothetical protein